MYEKCDGGHFYFDTRVERRGENYLTESFHNLSPSLDIRIFKSVRKNSMWLAWER
jgi:hypothetical protein